MQKGSAALRRSARQRHRLGVRRLGLVTLVVLMIFLLICLRWTSGGSEAPPSGVSSPQVKGTAAVGATLVPAYPFSPVSEDLLREKPAGSVWGDDAGTVHVLTDDGRVRMQFPRVVMRDCTAPDGNRSHAAEKWHGLSMPHEMLRVPEWASVPERNTLHHATIFTSIAAFRDDECATTVQSLLSAARSPHRLYIGISEERLPSDSSCLSALGLDQPGVAEALLWGDAAPANLQITQRKLTWQDVATGRSAILDVDAAVRDNRTSAAPADVPPGIYLSASHDKESITCLAGTLEEQRDRYLLQHAPHVFRRGRGGPQELPSPALAGCRVTTRVAAPDTARGPTYGRYITSLFYFNQDYYMIVDSHSRFSLHWDAKMIRRVFQMPTRGILSHYPNGYTPPAPDAEFNKTSVMAMCKGVLLSNGMPKLGARWMPLRPKVVRQAFAAAGYVFGDAQYTLDAPFDPFLPFLFDGEEILYSARVWTSGWDHYCPAEANIFHHYLRPNTPKFWSLMNAIKTAQRVMSERRALYFLQRAQPWSQILLDMRRSTTAAATTDEPTYIPPEQRFIVTAEEANRYRELSIERRYYGMGTQRTLPEYWDYTQLSDKFVKAKDYENRWSGGEGLCDEAMRA